MLYLGKTKHSSDTARPARIVTGGLDRSAAPPDGSISYMENIDFAQSPLLASRGPRRLLATLADPYMLCVHEGEIYSSDGGSLFRGSERIGTLSPGEKQFCSFGKRLIIFPDKLSYDSEKRLLEPLEKRYDGAAVFCDGTLWGEDCEANTIKFPTPPGFDEGDTVRISGAQVTGNDGLCLTVREISEDGLELRFYENSFGKGAEAQLSVVRRVPDLNRICVNENRLWGVHGSTVYGSKLGDPRNFDCFDGLSTDSYALEVSSAGDFTACTSYLGYPVFFKEDAVYKLYGSRPADFELLRSASLGVAYGAEKTLAVASEKLFYLSPAGFCVYSGGIPSLFAPELGPGSDYSGGAACSDGTNYFVSVRRRGTAELLVWAAGVRRWFREDMFDAVDMARLGSAVLALSSSGELCALRGMENEGVGESGTPEFDLVFSDMYMDTHGRKLLKRLDIRYELGPDSALNVRVMYDGDGIWRTVPIFGKDAGCDTRVLPFVPRRADRLRLRFSGSGKFALRSMTAYYGTGTSVPPEN